MKASVQTKEIREAILDATDRLLARYGYKKMTIEDIAVEVGIGKGSVYLHFSSKDEIVLSHIDRIVGRLIDRLKEISKLRIPCREKIRQMIVTRVMFRFDSVQHYTESLNDLLAALRPKYLQRRAKYFDTEAAVLSEVLTDGIGKGEFAAGEPADIAESLLIGTNSLLPYGLSASELGGRDELETKVVRITDLFLHGLLKGGK